MATVGPLLSVSRALLFLKPQELLTARGSATLEACAGTASLRVADYRPPSVSITQEVLKNGASLGMILPSPHTADEETCWSRAQSLLQKELTGF